MKRETINIKGSVIRAPGWMNGRPAESSAEKKMQGANCRQ